MIPNVLFPNVDRSFIKKLKNLDKRLNCVFRPEHEHFVITYNRGYGEPVNLHCVKAEDGGFRQPDTRDLTIIADGDLTNQRVKDRLRQTEERLYEIREIQKKKSAELVRERTKDDKVQLMNAFRKHAGVVKPMPAYRQVSYKPKGKVF